MNSGLLIFNVIICATLWSLNDAYPSSQPVVGVLLETILGNYRTCHSKLSI